MKRIAYLQLAALWAIVAILSEGYGEAAAAFVGALAALGAVFTKDD